MSGRSTVHSLQKATPSLISNADDPLTTVRMLQVITAQPRVKAPVRMEHVRPLRLLLECWSQSHFTRNEVCVQVLAVQPGMTCITNNHEVMAELRRFYCYFY